MNKESDQDLRSANLTLSTLQTEDSVLIDPYQATEAIKRYSLDLRSYILSERGSSFLTTMSTICSKSMRIDLSTAYRLFQTASKLMLLNDLELIYFIVLWEELQKLEISADIIDRLRDTPVVKLNDMLDHSEELLVLFLQMMVAALWVKEKTVKGGYRNMISVAFCHWFNFQDINTLGQIKSSKKGDFQLNLLEANNVFKKMMQMQLEASPTRKRRCLGEEDDG
eukprot:TRINITY_DN143_c0_g3_i5.p1 TRINITY_DN143_c0_g3~~TRINITY_DN143_c0_g3_i5.p1  ORF type:complete len:224 (-),score=32.47 TRINITY_DN143_c0_g3_i5:234-905(-)